MNVKAMREASSQGNLFCRIDAEIAAILLQDKTTGKNIIWPGGAEIALNDLFAGGDGEREIAIRPRALKGRDEQLERVRRHAEVFTPAWICNRQNNMIDAAWFGHAPQFNIEEDGGGWRALPQKVSFDAAGGKAWPDYVRARRLEIACGEGPYLASRYDSVEGSFIKVEERVGLLDRKLRIVGENTETAEEWLLWAGEALKSVYGYDLQGDNVFLARANLFLDAREHYEARFGEAMPHGNSVNLAKIIAWNVWQMDGLKLVIPGSCKSGKIVERDLFEEREVFLECEGCRTGDALRHNGTYCLVMDWQKGEPLRFADARILDR